MFDRDTFELWLQFLALNPGANIPDEGKLALSSGLATPEGRQVMQVYAKQNPDLANNIETGLKNVGNSIKAGSQLDQDIKTMFENDPEYKERLRKNQNIKSATNIINDSVDLLTGTLGYLTGEKQVKVSKEELAKSQRPSRPARLRREMPEVTSALNRIRQLSDPTATLSAYNQQADVAYNTALGQARQATGGQSGALASSAQGLHLGNLQSRLGAIQAAREAGMAGIQAEAPFINMMNYRDMANLESQTSLYPYDLRNYQLEQQAAGELGATGRQNRLLGLLSIIRKVPSMAETILGGGYKFDNGVGNLDIYNQV